MSQTQWTPEVRAMWAKLEGFQFDNENAVFDFETRLGQENGWSREFTSRVIREYKRFVLLAMHAGHPVTPSDEVDQAWHLHLVYTRSYWENLCGAALGRPLHHGPTRGGRAEGEKFADWYEKTRQSYVRIFGTAPPADIWPASAVRFDAKARFERVDRSRHWLLPKINLRKQAMAALTACAGLGLAACGKNGTWDGDTTFILLGLGFFALIVFVSYRSYKHGGGRGGNGNGCGSSGCSFGGGMSGCGSGQSGGGKGHSGCGTGDSGCSSHGGSAGCGTSGCGSSGCGGGGCGGGGD